jgi:hypothetical protein
VAKRLHTEGHITEMVDGKLFCDDHRELIETYMHAGSSTSATSSEGETNGEETASEDAEIVDQPTEKLDQNTAEQPDQPMDVDLNLDSKSDASNGETQANVANNSSGELKKKGRGRPRKPSNDSEDKNMEKPHKSVKKVTKVKGVKTAKPGKPSENLKRLKIKQKEKKLKDASGKVKKMKGEKSETENNNDMKRVEPKDMTTDDDEFPSLVIDIPGC